MEIRALRYPAWLPAGLPGTLQDLAQVGRASLWSAGQTASHHHQYDHTVLRKPAINCLPTWRANLITGVTTSFIRDAGIRER